MRYQISGTVMPVVEITLENQEHLVAQPGAMKWKTGNVSMNTNMHGGLFKSIRRTFSGEDLFLVDFESNGLGSVTIGHSFPGTILPVEISPGKNCICQKRAFLACSSDVDMDMYLQRKIGAGFFGGEGFVMQRLSGNGMAFVELDGEVTEIELGPGESLQAETGAVGMFEETVSMNIEMVKGLGNLFFGGEGLFLTTLTGPGKIWLQSMPIQSMAKELIPFFPSTNKR